MPQAEVNRHGKKVLITLDIAESFVNEIRKPVGVERSALIKGRLYKG
jgi:hypothetical protein